MAEWQYAQLVVELVGERVEKKFWSGKERTIPQWTWSWIGPHGKPYTTEFEGDFHPIQLLNERGAEGWEIIDVVRHDRRLEYLLKRLVT